MTLTRALTVIDPAAAAQQMEQVLAAAVERRDYETASATAGALVNYRQDAGQLGALWPAMPMGPLLGDIVAAATGDGAAAGRAQESLAELAAEPELGELAEALGRVLAGDRELGLAETLTDADARAAVVRAVVATVLAYVAG